MFNPSVINPPNIILSCYVWLENLSFLNTNTSLIYFLTPLISSIRSSTLAWNIYPKAHMPIGRKLYLNFPNSVTIFVMSLLAREILIVYYPMLRSNAVAYRNASSCCIFHLLYKLILYVMDTYF